MDLPDGVASAPANAEELPTARVSALPVTLTVTFGLKNDVAIGAPDMEVMAEHLLCSCQCFYLSVG